MLTKFILLSACLVFNSWAFARGTEGKNPRLPEKKLLISCPSQEMTFTVEMAKTPKEQAKGLMFRETLDQNAGMLFLYPTPRPISMWMKNTLLPLDMIFGDEEGNILALYENTTPFSLEMIGPVENTVHVLEVNAGTIQKKGITEDCVLKFDR